MFDDLIYSSKPNNYVVVSNMLLVHVVNVSGLVAQLVHVVNVSGLVAQLDAYS